MIGTKTGKLELIIGPMFSGKSTELINRIRKHRILKSNLLIINHILDNRYSKSDIVSHNNERETCISTCDLLELLKTQSYVQSNVVFVEEAQFFNDLKDFVFRAVEGDGKHVIVSGLDGDFQRQPFGQILELVPFADTVDKLKALCIMCGDGTPAIFSKRITKQTDDIVVGSLETYRPACRMHFLS